jgi:hypothetical protein
MAEVGVYVRVNWIYVTTTFTLWKNAITKIQVEKMSLQLFHTFKYAIVVNTQQYTGKYTWYILCTHAWS